MLPVVSAQTSGATPLGQQDMENTTPSPQPSASTSAHLQLRKVAVRFGLMWWRVVTRLQAETQDGCYLPALLPRVYERLPTGTYERMVRRQPDSHTPPPRQYSTDNDNMGEGHLSLYLQPDSMAAERTIQGLLQCDATRPAAHNDGDGDRMTAHEKAQAQRHEYLTAAHKQKALT